MFNLDFKVVEFFKNLCSNSLLQFKVLLVVYLAVTVILPGGKNAN